MREICEVIRLGRMGYEQAWRLQEQLAGEIAHGQRPPTLLLLEHPHTYTFGRQGQERNLLWDETERALRGVEVFWVDRGGDVTYHGPGQLVGYPLLPLAPGGLRARQGDQPRMPQADFVGYLRRLEAVLIAALATFGVTGQREPGLTGVWVHPGSLAAPPAKIAAIGVKVDVHGISRHGFALNIATDSTYWAGIIGCGLSGRSVTSLDELLPHPPSLAQVESAVVQAFAEEFGYQLVAGPASQGITGKTG